MADLMETPAAELQERLPAGKLGRGVDALLRLGLGHLALGRAARSLSGGAPAADPGGAPPRLGRADPAPPRRAGHGLHEADLQRLVGVLRGSRRAGTSS